MTWTRRAVLAVGAAAALAASLAAPPAGAGEADTQPLWRLRKGAATVYLYGDAGSVTPKWSAPRVEAAFAESAVFWKETPDYTAQDRAKFIALGVDRSRPLSSWLTPEQRATVELAATESGTTFAALEPLKPWLANLALGEAWGKSHPRPPVDDPIPILTARAKATNKPIRTEFADIDAQLAWITALSPAAQVEYLLYTIENNRLTQDAIDRRRRAWASGDLSLENRQVVHLKTTFPNLYVPIELERNRAWPGRIGKMLDGGGTTFVLVGADHLVGPDGILVQLSAAGLTAKRI